MRATPLLELRDIGRKFGAVTALSGVSLAVDAGQVHCLLGDNGAGKSTLIKILSGVHAPSEGELLVHGQPVTFGNPRDALQAGIATVYQNLAMVPLLSISRNFFLGREPVRRWGPFAVLDREQMARVSSDEMRKMGIDIRDPERAVGTLSGGQRQCVAIARAVYSGADVLVLDEPTSALGVTQTELVLQSIREAKARGLGVVFITHNVRHATDVGDCFTVLNQGRLIASRTQDQTSLEELQGLMSGRDGSLA